MYGYCDRHYCFWEVTYKDNEIVYQCPVCGADDAAGNKHSPTGACNYWKDGAIWSDEFNKFIVDLTESINGGDKNASTGRKDLEA